MTAHDVQHIISIRITMLLTMFVTTAQGWYNIMLADNFRVSLGVISLIIGIIVGIVTIVTKLREDKRDQERHDAELRSRPRRRVPRK